MLDPLEETMFRIIHVSYMANAWVILRDDLDNSGYIWIILDDLEHYHGRRNPDVTLHTLLFSVPNR